VSNRHIKLAQMDYQPANWCDECGCFGAWRDGELQCLCQETNAAASVPGGMASCNASAKSAEYRRALTADLATLTLKE